jgi:hypothetical protein
MGCRFDGHSLRAYGVGSSSTMSSQPVTSFAPYSVREFGPKLDGCVTCPGTPNTSRRNSIASRAVIMDPEYCAPSTTTTPSAMPAMIRFRIEKFCGALIPRAEPLEITSPLVSQVPRYSLSHWIPVGRRTSRAYHGNHATVQKFNVSGDIEQRRRIVNLPEPCGVLGFIPCEQSAARSLDLRQFLCRVAQRPPRMEGLGDRCRRALPFERRWRRAENRLGALGFGQQLPRRERPRLASTPAPANRCSRRNASRGKSAAERTHAIVRLSR